MQDGLLASVGKPREPYVRILMATLTLFPAIFVGRVGWVGMKVTDTALLGHVSSHALEASSLSDLWTSATGVLLQGRVLGIFVGNAIGAGTPKVAGEWLQVSLVIQTCIGLPVMALWSVTNPALQLFGVSADLIDDASYYSLVLMAAIPARIIFSAASQFLMAQRIVRPFAIAAIVGLALNLALGLVLVLGVPSTGFDGFGFAACPAVTTAVEYFQLGVLLTWTLSQRLHAAAWPDGRSAAGGLAVGGSAAGSSWGGWSWRYITCARVLEYLRLYVPAALSIGSDFWRMSLVGALAASLGDQELAVFTASCKGASPTARPATSP